MTRPRRIQLSRAAGWRMPPNAVKVDRTTVLGNPFTIRDLQQVTIDTPAVVASFHVSQWFRDWIEGRRRPEHLEAQRSVLLARLPELRGKDLACWCPPHRHCHADVLLDLANRPSDLTDPLHPSDEPDVWPWRTGD